MADAAALSMVLSVEISHAFESFTLDMAFDAPAGVTALFGRSGAGKTSLIRAVAGLLQPDHARISVRGRSLCDTDAGIELPPHHRRVGYVFQEPRLFPHKRVEGNILYGAPRSLPPKHRDTVVEMLGLGPLLDRRPAHLSGGEAQRVAIARALLSQPDVLLMDEPLASLDATRKAQILPFLERLRSESGVPILYVSHDMAEVARLADTLVVMADGRSVAAGPAHDVLSDPALVPHLGVQNAGAVLAARLVTPQAGDGLSEIAVGDARLIVPEIAAQAGAPLRLRIPATDVMIARTRPEGLSALNILPVTIVAIEAGRGPGVMVQLALQEARLLARITQRSANAMKLAPGQTVFAIVKTVSVAPGAIGVAPLQPGQSPLLSAQP